MIRVLSRAVLGLVLVGSLAGCTLGPLGARPSASPSDTPAVADSVDERCDGVIAPEDYAGLWDGEIDVAPIYPYGAVSTEAMAGTALIQSEALVCTWTRTGGMPAALVLAMGDGADGFRRSEALFAAADSPYYSVPILDGAYVACRGDDVISCHWNVLNGSDWISVFLVDVPQSEIVNPDLAATVPAQMVAALSEEISALKIPKTPTAAPTSTCLDRLTPDALAGPFGVDPSRISVIPSPALEQETLDGSPQTGQVMWKYAYELLGYSNCGIQIDGQLAGVAFVATGAAWVLHDSGASQPDLVEIGDHGDGIEDCTPQGDLVSCTVAFASGDDLYFAQLGVPSALDGAAIARGTLELLLD